MPTTTSTGRFDNSKPNIILLSDYTDTIFMMKTLGVHKLACGLRNAGFEVLVINHLHAFTVDEIKTALSHAVNENTIFVGVNSFFYQYTDSPTVSNEQGHSEGGVKYSPRQLGAYLPQGLAYNRELRDLITELNPKCKMVLGGHDAKDMAHAKHYDFLVTGYADISGVNLARHLAFGEPLLNTRRSIFGPTIVSDPEARDYNFVETPMVFTDNDVVLHGETLGIEISRGCVFKCTYCNYPLNGKKKNDYIKHEEILYNEFLDNFNKYGITRYTFSDDTFNDSRDKIEMIHRISKRLPFKLEYWAYIRADLLAAHIEDVDLLIDSGLRAAFMGIETMHPEAGRIVGKGGGRTKIIEMLDYVKKKYGDKIAITGSFIFGLPQEPIESMKETGRMLMDGTIKVDAFQVSPLRINPHHTFKSEFDINYQAYGYTITEHTQLGMNYEEGFKWENGITTFDECSKLASETRKENERINGRSSFCIAGLGYDIDFSINKKFSDLDWHSINLQKQKRAVQYKEQLFKILGVA